MKRIVVYQSGTGFTAKYAGWIAEELSCEAKELKRVSKSELADYDMVVYGGWIMAGTVVGYDKVKTFNLINLVVFGVGISMPDEEIAAKIAIQSKIPQERFFYFAGGYAPQKLGIMKKMMLNLIKKSVEKKENKTVQDIYMLESFAGVDHTSRDAAQDLVAYCMKHS
ncbi:MAG: flavodoxin domain-containing protein [Lachnospiraceae bacterium]